MNKIYKTVWNKARHCYVTVSELAKSQTKGCGLRSLLVAAVVLGGLGASAPGSATTYYGVEEEPTWVLEVGSDGTVIKGSDNAITRVQVAEGTHVATGDCLIGNWRSYADIGTINNALVTFNGSEVKRIFGGMSGWISDSNVSGSGGGSSLVSQNRVTFNGGKSQYIYGGSSNQGRVSNNYVDLNGGEIKQAVFGGVSDWQEATNNEVTVNNAQITDDAYKTMGLPAHYSSVGYVGVFGGRSSVGSADENRVRIKNGKFYAPVYGGYTGGTGHANNNSVEMKGGEASDSYIDEGLSGGPVDSIYGGYAEGGSANGNIVSIGKNAVTGKVNGGYAAYDGQNRVQTADGNLVDVSGSAKVNGGILGGYSGGRDADSHANKNTVTVSGNASVGNNASTVNIRGGVSGNSDAAENKIIIKTENPDEKVSVSADRYLNITAGQASRPESGEHRGAATKNTISFSGNVFVGLTGDNRYGASIIAGYTDAGDAKDNTITIDINNGDNLGIGKISNPSDETEYKYTMVAGKGYKEVSGNSIEITKGKVYLDDMTAGYSYSGYSGGNVTDNHVTISGSDTDIKADTIYGGRSERNTNQALTDLLVQNNSVTITGSTVDGGVHGGRAVSGAVQNNTVKITDAKMTNANLAYGGSFLMSGGGIVGGFTKYGNAADNSVSISNTSVGGDYSAIVGGAYSEGDAGTAVTHNTVTLDNVTSTGILIVVGAVSEKGIVGGDTAEKGNQVSITDSTVAAVIGGVSKEGDVKNNTVTIKGGTVTGEIGVLWNSPVFGGYAAEGEDKQVTNNTVQISDGAIINTNVYGGYAYGGSANENTVAISGTGTTVEGHVYGGYVDYVGDGTATSNTVTLGGVDVSGLVYGGKAYVGKDVVTGNKLVLSTVGNTVGSDVRNFQTIELADTVTWRNGETVLAANAFKENEDTDKTRAGLDIKAVQNAFANETSGKMTLLASNTADDFKTLSLTTNGSTDTLDENTSFKILKQGEQKPDAGVNGVTITSASTHSVTLDKANSYKNVLYTISGLASKVTLGGMTWGTPRDVSADGLEFNAATAIDASGLTFAGTDTTLLKKDDTMTLVKGAAGITGNDIKQPGENKGTVAVEYTDTNNITFDAKAKGTVGVDANDVKYTVESVTVDKITLGKKAWGSAADNLPDSSWHASASTQIDATNFEYTGKAKTALKKDQTVTILNAKDLTSGNSVENGTDKTVAVDYKENGIAFDATAKGNVKAATDAVNYVVSTVTVNGVNLDKWNGTTTAVTSGWEGENVAVDTGNFKTPSGLSNGSKVVLTADKVTFGTVTGAKAYKDDEAFAQENQNGVKLDGKQVGGVKATDNGSTLTYYDMRKTGTVLTLGTITTAFAAGGKAVATYDSGYDLTAAEITAGDDFKFTDGIKDAKAGDQMVVVDATEAIKNADNQTLKDFGGKDVDVEFSDDVKEKLNLKGTRSDKLTQNGAKTQLIYTVGDKNVAKATFSGPIAWNADEAYYTNDGYQFNAKSTIDASGLSFGQTTQLLKNNDSMTLLSGAEGVTSGSITQPSAGVAVEYTDSKNIKFNATANGTVGVASNDVKYTVGSVTTDKVTLTSIAWGTTASLPDSSWTASASTKIDATNFAYTGTVTTPLTVGNTATILNATGLTAASPVTKGTNKTVSVDHTDTNSINYLATASGHVTAAADKANYVVDSVTVSAVDLSNWNTTGTSTVANDWTSSGLTVNTGRFTTSLTPGSSKDIVTAADGFFTGATYTGDNKYVNDDLDAEDKNKNGVKLAGTQTGGVKANDAGNTLTYYAKKKTGTELTLGTITTAFANGGTVATYGSEFDLTGADIKAKGLAFTEGLKQAKAGDTMTVVDASEAIQDEKGHTLQSFDGESYEKTFNDKVKDALTLAGTRTDTLSQVDGQKLVYTVGDKNVETASFSGPIQWATGSTYYTNDGYQFKDGTKIDASSLTFDSVNEALATDAKMTLISADGISESNTVTQPSAGTLDVAYTDGNGIAFEATAEGEVKAADGAVNYQVSGVGLNKVDLTAWDGSAASDVPDGWILAEGATVETDGMNVPDVATGKQAAIVNSAAGFFANATINGENAYGSTNFNESDGGIQFAGTQEKGVTAASSGLVYKVGTKDVATATLSGTIAWNTDEAYYTNNEYTFKDKAGETEGPKIDLSGVTFTSDTDPLNTAMTLIAKGDENHAVKGAVSGAPDGFTFALDQGSTTLEATASGGASIEDGSLQYAVNSVTLDKVTVNSAGNVEVPDGWAGNANGVAVDTENMDIPTDASYGNSKNVLTSNSAIFSDENISGKNKYASDEFSESENAITLAGKQGKGVKAADGGKRLVYEVGQKMVSDVTIGGTGWQKGATLLDRSSDEYNYSGVTTLGGDFSVDYGEEAGGSVTTGDTMTLLKANKTLTLNTESDRSDQYSYSPATGVTVDGTISGKLAANGGAVTYTVAKNQADRISFGNVDWKDSGALLVRPDNISFNGAAVDTSNIYFTNRQALEANQQMTLVSNFDGKPGALTGTTYKVGTAYVGEGHAEFEDGNLYFMTDTGAGRLSDETHAPVMTMAAGLAMLAAGNDFIMKAEEGLKDTSVYVSVGGATSRYKTGSHVNTNTKNIIAAVGGKKGFEAGTLGVGVFAEYGEGNYKLHGSNTGGHGEGHYAGGGLLAKWTDPSNWYTEASIRLGRLSNDAKNILHDGAGRGYGYDKHTTYYGAHLGVGKVFEVDKGRSLDVYGKYFYTNYDGMNFTASGDRYKLDDVTSSVIRTGLRYASTDQRWNWYGGLAYEYEFDGEAKGKVNGDSVKSADLQGSSLRGEFGLKMDSTDTCPWKADIGVYGYTGKHRGVGGSVTVGYSF